MERTKYTTVDQYIASFPPGIARKLQQVRKVIRNVAPDAEEIISYNIPGYKYHGILIYFAAFKSHIGMYPIQLVEGTLARQVAKYRTSKGTAQFRYDEPIPFDLIEKIVKQRMKLNTEKAGSKIKPKKK